MPIRYKAKKEITMISRRHYSTSSNSNGKNNIIPAVVYTNAETQKQKILKENQNKSAIYR